MANNVFKIKRTSISGRAANTSTLTNPGELALNMTDGIMYSTNGSSVFEVGANLTSAHITNSLTFDNDRQLRFKTVNTSSYAYFVQQSDDNFVFYTTNGSYSPRAVYSIYANSGTSNLNFGVWTQFGANVTLAGVALYSNGSPGSAGQVLTSNGTATYWSTISAGGGSVNTDAQFIWNNTHTFSANVSFSDDIALNTNNAIYFGGLADANWRMARNSNTLTKWIYTNNTIDIVTANSPYEGFAIGLVSNTTYFETGYLGTYVKDKLVVGNTSSNVTINSTTFTGTANNSNYLGGNTASDLRTYTDNKSSNAYSNAVSYIDTAIGTANSAITGNAATAYTNAVSYVDGKSYVNTSQLSSNLSNYVTTTNLSNNLANYQTTAGLSDNVATLSANSATHLGNSSGTIANVVSWITSNASAAYTNAISYTDTVIGTANSAITGNAATAYTNAVSYTDSKILTANSAITGNAATAYTNAVSYVDGKSYVNTSQLSNNLSNYALLSGATFTGNVVANNANTTYDLNVGRNLTVAGNLTITGNVTVIGANTFSIVDNMFYLNSNNTTQNVDLGFAGNYNDGTYHHAGFFRDATDGVWKVFDNYDPEPDAAVNIDTTNTTFHIANFQANVVYVGNTTVYSTVNTTNFSGTSNNSLYLGGTLASGYQTTAGLSANVATLAANSATYLGNSSGTIANVASWITSNASAAYTNAVSYVDGKSFVNTSQLSSNLSNYVTTTNLTNNLANYQTTAGLNANIAAYLPNYTGIVNGSSHTVGTNFISNTTGVYHTGVIYSNYNNDGQILLGTDSNGQLEIGKQGRTNAGSPYIDFHSSASSPDFDVRFSVSGGNSTSGSANLAITAIGSSFSGSLNAASHTVGSNFIANSTVVYTTGSVLSYTTSEWPIESRFASTTTTNRPSMLMQRANNTLASPTAVTSGMYLGGISMGGYDGSNWSSGWNGGAEVMAVASEAWSNTAKGTGLFFNVTAAGSNTLSLGAAYVAPNGNFGIGNTAPTHKLRVEGTTSVTANLTVESTGELVIAAGAGIYANGSLGSANQVLTSNGSAVYWASAASSVAGSNEQIQFNDNGTLAGDAGLTYNKTTDTLTSANLVTANILQTSGGNTSTRPLATAGTFRYNSESGMMEVYLGSGWSVIQVLNIYHGLSSESVSTTVDYGLVSDSVTSTIDFGAA